MCSAKPPWMASTPTVSGDSADAWRAAQRAAEAACVAVNDGMTVYAFASVAIASIVHVERTDGMTGRRTPGRPSEARKGREGDVATTSFSQILRSAGSRDGRRRNLIKIRQDPIV